MVKWQLSGCELSSAIVDVMREMPFRLSSDMALLKEHLLCFFDFYDL